MVTVSEHTLILASCLNVFLQTSGTFNHTIINTNDILMTQWVMMMQLNKHWFPVLLQLDRALHS